MDIWFERKEIDSRQAGELKNADLNAYIESLGVKDFFQWLMKNTRMGLLNPQSIWLWFWTRLKWSSRDWWAGSGIELFLMPRIRKMLHIMIGSRWLSDSALFHSCRTEKPIQVPGIRMSSIPIPQWRPVRKRQAHSLVCKGSESRFLSRKQCVCAFYTCKMGTVWQDIAQKCLWEDTLWSGVWLSRDGSG